MSMAISSASTATTLLSSTSSSDTSVASLEAQLAAKQQALSEAKTDDDKATIQDEIDALTQQISAAELSKSSSGSKASAPPPPPADALSGESDRIGTINFDDNTPDGEREAYF